MQTKSTDEREPAEQDTGLGKPDDPASGVRDFAIVVHDHAAPALIRCFGPLDDPTLGQDDEALDRLLPKRLLRIVQGAGRAVARLTYNLDPDTGGLLHRSGALLALRTIGVKPFEGGNLATSQRHAVGSVALAGCGVACLAYAGRHSYALAPLGFLLGLVAGLGWACGTLIPKRGGLIVLPIVSTRWQLLIAGMPIAVVVVAAGTDAAFVPAWTTLLVIGCITIVPMALGNIVSFSIVGLRDDSCNVYAAAW